MTTKHTTVKWLIFSFSQPYINNYGEDGKGSERKWCVYALTYRHHEPDWLEVDLLYRRYITRAEVVLFSGIDEKWSQYMSYTKLRFSEDRVSWKSIRVSPSHYGRFAIISVYMEVRDPR